MAFLKDIDLETQVRMLSDQISSLKELAARRGNKGYDDASDAVSGYFADLSNAVTSVLPVLAKRGRLAGAAASNHPAAVAAIGLLVVGLVASLFLSAHLPEDPARQCPVSGSAQLRKLLKCCFQKSY